MQLGYYDDTYIDHSDQTSKNNYSDRHKLFEGLNII
jgi:hypothetical protein